MKSYRHFFSCVTIGHVYINTLQALKWLYSSYSSKKTEFRLKSFRRKNDMIGYIVKIVFVIFLTAASAKPINDKDCDRKGKYYQVNCAEQLQFFNHKATCFMNDNGDFMIMTMDASKDIPSTESPPKDYVTQESAVDIRNNAEISTKKHQLIEPDSGKFDDNNLASQREEDLKKQKEKKAKEDEAATMLLAILGYSILSG